MEKYSHFIAILVVRTFSDVSLVCHALIYNIRHMVSLMRVIMSMPMPKSKKILCPLNFYHAGIKVYWSWPHLSGAIVENCYRVRIPRTKYISNIAASQPITKPQVRENRYCSLICRERIDKFKIKFKKKKKIIKFAETSWGPEQEKGMTHA